MRQLDALADARRPPGVREVREVGGGVEGGVEVPVGRVAGEQVGEVDLAVRQLEPGGEVEGVRLPGDDTVSTGVPANAPRTKGSTWSQVIDDAAPASVSWAARSGAGSSGLVGEKVAPAAAPRSRPPGTGGNWEDGAATTSPRPMPWSASQPATACARRPSSVNVRGTSC